MKTEDNALPKSPVSRRCGLSAAGLIFLVLVSGYAVRRIGLRHGKPNIIFHPDVGKQCLVASSVCSGGLNLRSLFKDNHKLTLYPYGTAMLVGRISRWIDSAGGQADCRRMPLWTWDVRLRWLAVISFLGAVCILLIVLRPRIGSSVALLTGLLLVLEPLNAQYSHYGMNDVPLTGLLLAAWLASGGMDGRRAGAALSFLTGLLLGLGFGVKYQAVIGLVFPAVAWWGLARQRRVASLLPSVVSVGIGFLLGAVVTMPLLTEDFGYFVGNFPRFMRWQSDIIGAPTPLGKKIVLNTWGFLKLFAGSFRWVLLLGAVVAAFRLRLDGDTRDARLKLAALLFCGALSLTLVVGRGFVRSNDILPILAFLAAVFGLDIGPKPGATMLSRRTRLGETVAAVIAVIVFGASSLADSLALRRTDTRVRARDWCRENVPPNASILRERYTLAVHGDEQKERDIRDFRSDSSQRVLENSPPDYLVLSSLAHDRFFDPLSPYSDSMTVLRYREIETRFFEVAAFRDRKLIFAHPEVRVLRRRVRRQ